jgi:hypothetical protein
VVIGVGDGRRYGQWPHNGDLGCQAAVPGASSLIGPESSPASHTLRIVLTLAPTLREICGQLRPCARKATTRWRSNPGAPYRLACLGTVFPCPLLRQTDPRRQHLHPHLACLRSGDVFFDDGNYFRSAVVSYKDSLVAHIPDSWLSLARGAISGHERSKQRQFPKRCSVLDLPAARLPGIMEEAETCPIRDEATLGVSESRVIKELVVQQEWNPAGRDINGGAIIDHEAPRERCTHNRCWFRDEALHYTSERYRGE